jgi:hypothetical protein
MANDFHGRLDDVVTANFCGLSFQYSHGIFVPKAISTSEKEGTFQI